ncbi:MAG: hypothetical protein ACI80N_002162, partial [Gammaproteobacteria bacterium]
PLPPGPILGSRVPARLCPVTAGVGSTLWVPTSGGGGAKAETGPIFAPDPEAEEANEANEAMTQSPASNQGGARKDRGENQFVETLQAARPGVAVLALTDPVPVAAREGILVQITNTCLQR